MANVLPDIDDVPLTARVRILRWAAEKARQIDRPVAPEYEEACRAVGEWLDTLAEEQQERGG